MTSSVTEQLNCNKNGHSDNNKEHCNGFINDIRSGSTSGISCNELLFDPKEENYRT